MVGIAGLNFSSAAVDVVGLYTSEFKQLFSGARPVKVTVKPTAKLMEHPVETGAVITDFRILNPIEIEMAFILNRDNYKDVYDQITNVFLKATPIIVQVRGGVFKSQIIGEMPHEEDSQLFDTIKIVLKLKQVQFVTAKYGVVPRNPSNSSNVKRGGLQPKDASERDKTVAAGGFDKAADAWKKVFK